MDGYKESEFVGENQVVEIDLIVLLLNFIQAIKKFWWLAIAIIVGCTAFSYFSTSITYRPNYVASATIAVKSVSGNSAAYSNNKAAESMQKILPYLLTSGVLSDVIEEDLGLDSIPGSISAGSDAGTNLFIVSVSSSDAQMAYDILQSVIKNYPKVGRFVLGDLELEVLDETGVPTDTHHTQIIRGSYKRGALAGGVIAMIILLIYAFSRNTVKGKRELKEKLNMEDLGSLPFITQKKRRMNKISNNQNLSMMNGHLSYGYMESMRRLRYKISRKMDKNGYKSILITSSTPNEGKTTIATNLAISLADQGKDVLLIDCDIRHPAVAEKLNLESEHPGLEAVLNGTIDVNKAITTIETTKGKFQAICATKTKGNGSKIFDSNTLKDLISNMKEEKDIVILDCAPSELLADATVLGKYVDAAIYVIMDDYVKMRQIKAGVQALAMSGVDILGYVFNGERTLNGYRSNYGYGYGYGYGRYGNYGHYRHYGHYGNERTKIVEDRNGDFFEDETNQADRIVEDDFGRVYKD